ncbi:MAG: hypothetical protein IJ697_09180 [Synergistaceae bacterium]|nr:hypothetical protein [Synergistaceae bacterium]
MKKFLFKNSIYALIVIVATLGINTLYIYETKKVLGNSADFFGDVPDGIQICNFGSSHGLYGFNYKDAEGKYTCFNFGLSSQYLEYDYKILQYYRDKIQKGAVVFIPVSYFSFFGKPEYEEKSFASKNKRYYKFLPREMITKYDWKTDLYVNYLPALSPEGLSTLAKLLLNIASSNDKAWEVTADPIKVNNDAKEAYERHIVSHYGSNCKRVRRHDAFEALYGIIKLCHDIGVRPIMITVPYLKEYTDTVKTNDPEFFGDFYAVIDEIKRNTGIEYYDYAFDSRFCKNYKLFMNSDHLNREGARLFTDILFREVLGIDVGRAEEYGL